MFNLHLLQKELTVEEYENVMRSTRYNSEWRQLPAHLIARCPICSTKNIERLDTYTIRRWKWFVTTVSKFVFHPDLVVHHCEHFALVQIFFSSYGILYNEICGSHIAAKEAPYVIGHLLESGRCLAVMHALPVCRIEDNTFVPRYTLFIISYFSEQPKEAIRDVEQYNLKWYNIGESSLYLPLQFGDKKWAILRHWVAAGQLYWVDSRDPNLGVQTHDVDAFPYGDVTD